MIIERLCLLSAFILLTLPPVLASFESSIQVVKHWDFLGPFPIGKAEVDGDSLEAFGGIRVLEKNRNTKNHKSTGKSKKGGELNVDVFYSELVDGGKVGWRSFDADKDGMVKAEFSDVNWNKLVQLTSSVTITEFQGWAVSEVHTHAGRYMVSCSGIHTFEVDDSVYVGDQYNAGNVHAVLNLEDGSHMFRVRVRAKGRGVFGCKLEIIDEKKSLRVYPSITTPDVLDGALYSEFIGVTTQNVGSSFASIEFAVKPNKASPVVVTLHPQHSNPTFKIAPGQTTVLPVRIVLENPVGSCEDVKFKLEVSAMFEGATATQIVTRDVALRCRTSSQSFVFTFLDFDQTISYAAAVVPANKECDDTVNCPIVVSMHGTGVPAQDQADSFKRMDKSNNWIFGVDYAWVLAPTRHGAHNWEGVGSRAISAAIAALHPFSIQFSVGKQLKLIADVERLIVTGHSMGGHGAWHYATHNPDLVLCTSAQAGWIKKEYYGDSNVLFEHDIGDSHSDSVLRGLIESSITENDVDLIASNLKGIPILARIGADDSSVPPWQMRRMVRVLVESGCNLTYTELIGKGHWWWDTEKTNDGGVMNDNEMRKFYKKCIKKSLPDLPAKLTIKTTNPASMSSRAGIHILQLQTPYRHGRLDLSYNNQIWTITTGNLHKIAFKKPTHLRWPDVTKIIVDGVVIEEVANIFTGSQPLCKTGRTWALCVHDTTIQRSPSTYGPARQVFESQFVIVVGTRGSDSDKTSLFESGLYLANSHFMAHSTYAPLVLDTDFRADQYLGRNVILVGGSRYNSAATVATKAVNVTDNSVKVGECDFQGHRRGILYLAPWSDQTESTLALVLDGTDIEGIQDIIKVGMPTIPPMTRGPYTNMVPDWLVTGPEFSWKGVGGYLGGGYWGNNWEWRSDTSYCLQ